MRRREAKRGDYVDRLYQAAAQAVWQRAQTAPSPRIGETDQPNGIDGTGFVVGSPSNGLYRQDLKHIEALRQAVFSDDVRILSAWTLAIIAGYYGRYILALDLLALAAGLFYLKFVRAAKAPCPSCQQPFGSAEALPTRLGGDVCQHCGLSLKAMR